MTLSQQFKKMIYPALKMAGKWMGMNGKRVINTQKKKPATPLYAFRAHTNQGMQLRLDDYRGKYLLITNTASHCGYTAQYAELQQLQDRFAGKIQVLAFPADDFGGQEPGNDAEISQFCSINFGVKFPVMMKSEVTGPGTNPIFRWLSDPAQNGWNERAPGWNFSKYLVSPEGVLLGYFESGVSPLDASITGCIQ